MAKILLFELKHSTTSKWHPSFQQVELEIMEVSWCSFPLEAHDEV